MFGTTKLNKAGSAVFTPRNFKITGKMFTVDEENPEGTYEISTKKIKVEGERPKALSIPPLEMNAQDLKEYMLKRTERREQRRMRECKKTLEQIDHVKGKTRQPIKELMEKI